MALTISLRGVLNAPFRKRVRADAFPLNQYHSPLGKGTDVNICPFGVVWVAPFREGRSVRYHSRWSFLMLLNSLDCILAIQCMTISGFQGCPLTRMHKCGNIMRILQSYKAKLPYGRNTKALQFVKYKSSALYVRGAIREIYESHISCHTKQYIVWQEWNTKAIRCMTEKYLVEKVCGVPIDTIFGWFTF